MTSKIQEQIDKENDRKSVRRGVCYLIGFLITLIGLSYLVAVLYLGSL